MSITARGQTSWLAYCRPDHSARLRLFCFPHAGGGASAYRTWSTAFPPGIEVLPVQLPGRETRVREPSYHRVEPLAEAAAEALQPWFDVPFCLFGHSMGAIVALEVARELRHDGITPAALVVSGRPAPHLPDRKGAIYNLPHDEFIAELMKFNGTSPAAMACPELMELMLPVLRADCEVCDCYEHQPDTPFDFSLLAYGGLADPDVNAAELEGWRRYTTGPFVARTFPGDHFYLQSQRASVLQTLARDLARISAGQPLTP